MPPARCWRRHDVVPDDGDDPEIAPGVGEPDDVLEVHAARGDGGPADRARLPRSYRHLGARVTRRRGRVRHGRHRRRRAGRTLRPGRSFRPLRPFRPLGPLRADGPGSTHRALHPCGACRPGGSGAAQLLRDLLGEVDRADRAVLDVLAGDQVGGDRGAAETECEEDAETPTTEAVRPVGRARGMGDLSRKCALVRQCDSRRRAPPRAAERHIGAGRTRPQNT